MTPEQEARLSQALLLAAREGDNSPRLTVSERALELFDAATPIQADRSKMVDAGSSGLRLRARRQQLALSVHTVAQRLGVADVTVRAHENGQNDVPVTKAERYAHVLGVTPEWLLWGKGDA